MAAAAMPPQQCGAMNVLLVDDQPTALEMLGAVVRRAFTKARVRTACDLAEGLQRARNADWLDLVLLDLGLPGCSGIEALLHFRREFPATRVLVVSAREDRATVTAALVAGAAGYVPKTAPLLKMVEAIRLVADGGTYIPAEVFAPGVSAPDKAITTTTDVLGLTEREVDVLRLLAQGMNNKEIARVLDMAEESAKQHVREVFRALGVSSRTEALVIATRRGVRLT
jgi:DNA-binding NarL/FixJ family response regulator